MFASFFDYFLLVYEPVYLFERTFALSGCDALPYTRFVVQPLMTPQSS